MKVVVAEPAAVTATSQAWKRWPCLGKCHPAGGRVFPRSTLAKRPVVTAVRVRAPARKVRRFPSALV